MTLTYGSLLFALATAQTPKNMSFADHMLHIADFNETMGELIGGAKPPQHSKLAATATKAQLATFYGSQISRADAIPILSGDWSDHYAVTATCLRLNGLLQPTAK